MNIYNFTFYFTANLRNQTNIDAPNQREEANNKNCYGTYNVSVLANHFNTIETYSIQFEEICTNGNVSRATQRTLRFLINSMLADAQLGKEYKKINT
jgi:hypothetical protein